jgi:formylglycine-generating enzyme required for sulfatase activity
MEQKTRLAVIALHLGETQLLNETLQFQSDPELREQFIERYPGWRGQIAEAIEAMEKANDVSIITGLGKAIGLVPIQEYSQSEKQQLESATTELFENHDSPAVRSTTSWLLRKFHFANPESTSRQIGDPWFTREFGPGETITFLKVESQIVPVGSGLNQKELTMFSQNREDEFLDHDFYMSAKEIRASLFVQFVESLEETDPTRVYFEKHPIFQHLEKDIPIFNLDWNEAVRFCNWLSEQDDRSTYYLRGQDGDWVATPGANGYRLATNLEWDAANRAGTTTRFFFGDLSTRLPRYATTEDHEFPVAGLNIGYRGRKMPNDNGFFDTIGNASEWCQDGNPNRDSPDMRTLRGGQTLSSTRWLTSGCLFDQAADSRLSEPGLRIVLDVAH